MLRWRLSSRLALICMLLGFTHAALARPLMVAAAASLEESVREASAAFQKTHPGVKVEFNFAGSHVIARQVEAGAPIDIFLSADETILEGLAQKKLLAEGPIAKLFSNRLVVIVPPGAKFAPKTPEDLKRPEIKTIALGDPNVPVGKYAAAYLEKVGVMPAIKSKVTTSENVRATLALVVKKRADAGMVYRTDVAIAKPAPTIAWEVPASDAPPIVYGGAVTKSCSDMKSCRSYLEFLSSGDGKGIFTKAGFTPLPTK